MQIEREVDNITLPIYAIEAELLGKHAKGVNIEADQTINQVHANAHSTSAECLSLHPTFCFWNPRMI